MAGVKQKSAWFHFHGGRGEITIAGRVFRLPASRAPRIAVGVALVLGGTLGFLPVLGFWMIPLGLLVLSQDLPAVRRWRRRLDVRMGQRSRARQKPPKH